MLCCLWAHYRNEGLNVTKDERIAAEMRMITVQKEVAALEAEQAAYGACDPVVVEQKQRAVLLTHEAAIRWTGAHRRPLLLSAPSILTAAY